MVVSLNHQKKLIVLDLQRLSSETRPALGLPLLEPFPTYVVPRPQQLSPIAPFYQIKQHTRPLIDRTTLARAAPSTHL